MITHLSASQLNMFQGCAEQWRRRYLEGEIIPPGIAARVGSGVHTAAEMNGRQKITTGEDLPLDVLQDAAAESYHKSLQGGVFIPADELAGAKLAMAEGKDTAVSLTTLYREELAPTLQPELVEHRVELDLGLDIPVVTILDLYTKDGVLHDLKTAARRWTEAKAGTSHQPTLYRESVLNATGHYPTSMVFDVLVKSKKPQLQTVTASRDQSDTETLKRQFTVMLAMIRTGVFPPAEPDSWRCSPKWCGYFGTCPYISLHRRSHCLNQQA